MGCSFPVDQANWTSGWVALDVSLGSQTGTPNSPLGKGNAWSETDFDPWNAGVPLVSGPLEPAEAAID